MYRHLLVPLDGSRFAESALPAAAELARRMGAHVMLVHVLETEAPPTVHGDRHLQVMTEADAYLAGAVQWMVTRGVKADGAVCSDEGGVAASIAKRAQAIGADLIVLTSHGRSGVRGLLHGRVAQQVLQRGQTPVLLMQPSPQGRAASFTCQRVMVPLDGSDTAEGALQPASAIAHACAAELLLVWVVPTVETMAGERAVSARLMPTAAAELLEVEAHEAVAYVERVAARLRAPGLTVRAVVERGEPVQMLLDTAVRRSADLIVMATHGRSGVSAVWAGSVASRVVAAATKPVLLVRISA